MSTYFKGKKDYVGQNLNEKWTDLTKNDNFIEAVSSLSGSSGPLEVLTTYPTTDASKAGTEFIYKGNRWSYMTQAEIDDLGWDVSLGFPAPIIKNYNFQIIAPGVIFYNNNSSSINITTPTEPHIVDFIGLGNPHNVQIFTRYGGGFNVSEVKNASLLINLEDLGTLSSLNLNNSNMSALTIDDLFTQLPPTTKTATINVASNPGSGTCDPTIATSKGYIVIT